MASPLANLNHSLLLLALGTWACTSSAPPATPTAEAPKKKSSNADDEREYGKGDDDDELQMDEDTSSEEESEGAGDKDSETDDPEADPFISLLHADKLKSCHDDGKVYDRRTASGDDEGECHVAKHPAAFDCDEAGIKAAFNNSTNIKNYLAKQDTDGFEIDQCGSYDNGDPIVFFTKKEGSTAEDAELRVRVVEPK